ncbi:DUF2683 domain-containing protein [archaeon]|nr:DUF2683 domain-containing protein [archaeon]
MVQAIIKIEEHTNQVLNIVKAKYGLRDKSAAINLMASQYESELLEPEFRPEYIKKLQQLKTQTPIAVGTVENLKKRIGL